MKAEQDGQGRAAGVDPGVGMPPAASVVAGNSADSVSATDLLVELGLCQRGIRELLRTATASLGPISNQILPGVTFTLTGLIHATETAANKVLDHAEGLAGDRERLGKALARLEPQVNMGNPAAKRAWLDVMECSQALSGRVMSIMSAMAFQDLTTQHLAGAIRSLEEVREQLTRILLLLDLPVEDAPAGWGTPSMDAGDGARQALADQLWAEMKQR